MNINDLKVGDRVKYDFGENTILDVCSQGDGIIQKFVAPDRVKISGIPFDFNLKWLTSKLELVPKVYKEIPIEKDTFFWAKIERVQHYEYTTPVTTYHCPVCDKQLWGTCGMPIKQIANEPCEECKKKSTPKSFKFDISYVNRLEFNQEPFTPDSIGSCYFKIDGVKISYHSDNPKDFPEIFDGKEFTIEIKEKK